MSGHTPRLLIIGNRTHSAQILRHILETGIKVVGVIGAAGKLAAGQSGYTSFESVCEAYDVPLVETANINQDRVQSFVEDVDPTVGICCGWTQIIAPKLLTAPDYGIAGFHMSPLPKGRGGAPANWQLIRDQDRAGVSLFEMEPEVDDGALWGQTTVPIQARDNIETLYNRLTRASCRVADNVLTTLENGTFEATEQDTTAATYFPQRVPDDGLVDWRWKSRFIDRWIRAQTHPYPGAFTMYDQRRLYLWEAHVVDRHATDHGCGDIVSVDDGDGLTVATGNGVIQLDRVQSAGKPPLWADEFARDHSLQPGDSLGDPTQFPEWLYTGIRDGDGEFDYQTNLPLGETGRIRAVCCSHDRPRTVGITASLDGTEIASDQIIVDGWEHVTVPYTLHEARPHLLKLVFTEDGERVDVRRLKLYGR
jgi:methionyl-tRNA formyltransferase